MIMGIRWPRGTLATSLMALGLYSPAFAQETARVTLRIKAGYFQPLTILGVNEGIKGSMRGSPAIAAGVQLRLHDWASVGLLGTASLIQGSRFVATPDCTDACDTGTEDNGTFLSIGSDIVLHPRSNGFQIGIGAGFRSYHFGALYFACSTTCGGGTYFLKNQASFFVRPFAGYRFRGRTPIEFEVGPYLSRYKNHKLTVDLFASLGASVALFR